MATAALKAKRTAHDGTVSDVFIVGFSSVYGEGTYPVAIYHSIDSGRLSFGYIESFEVEVPHFPSAHASIQEA